MSYLLALVVLIAVAVLCWKAFGPQRPTTGGRRVVGPDDDPEFLWRMGRRTRGGQSGPTDPVD